MSNRAGRRKPTVEPYHLTLSRLSLHPVSSHSLFSDSIWRFDTLVAGRGVKGINWHRDVDEAVVASNEYQSLISDAKRILLCYMVEKSPRPQTIIEKGISLRQLAIWMAARKYDSFEVLYDAARIEYFDHVCGQYMDDDCNIQVVSGTIDRAMGAITLVYEMREFFYELPRVQLGLGQMRGLLWGGAGRQKGAREVGKIPAVPEEVFRSLMAEALTWIDVYSHDVLALINIEQEASARCAHWKSNSKTDYINKCLSGFQFSKSPVTGLPWREILLEFQEEEEVTEEGTFLRRLGALKLLRRMADDLIAACAIVIQGFTGMRVSEVLGLRQDGDYSGGLPSCVTLRPEMDGLNNVFHVNGRVYKGNKSDEIREEKWVVGVRPADSDYEPEVVRALSVVLTLVEGWRPLSGSDHVLIYPTSKGIPRGQGLVKPLTATSFNRLQQRFVKRNVRLPAEFMGWRVTSHQYRKKFAQDIVRCDPAALPALREHFKHLSMHILETGYIGNDTDLLRLIDDVALRDAAAIITDIVDGEMHAGKIADEIRKVLPQISPATMKNQKREEKDARFEEMISTEALRAWPCQFGTCLFRAEAALCHLAGKGEYDRSAIKPLAAERFVDRCCLCSNLVISNRHVDFWKERHAHNEELRLRYNDDGNSVWARLAAQRAKVAASILKSLGAQDGRD